MNKERRIYGLSGGYLSSRNSCSVFLTPQVFVMVIVALDYFAARVSHLLLPHTL
jgi:hypothetical protein